MKLRLVFLGAPGAGKGTQADKLGEYLHLPHIDTGSMLRSAIAEGSEMGRIAESFISVGKLVPIEIVVGVIRERLQKPDCADGFILDGFPRNLEQAKGLDIILNEIDEKITNVINIDIPEDILIDRMAQRKICTKCEAKFNLRFNPPKIDNICDRCGGELYQRADDSVENAKRRIETYKNETEPLIEYYRDRGLLININGFQEINNIFRDIVKALGYDYTKIKT